MTVSGRPRRRALTLGVVVTVLTAPFVVSACSNARTPTTQATGSGDRRSVVVYRQTGCTCCATYAEYLRKHGFRVTMRIVDDLAPIRQKHHVPDDGVGCHTSVIDSYVVEGHVPVEAIDRLLAERPSIDGISVTGMPLNSPGMGEPNGQPVDVMKIDDGSVGDFTSVTAWAS